MKIVNAFCLSLVIALLASAAHADALDDLSRDFWHWRAGEMPVSTDDIPRLDRPAGWIPDWSPSSVESYRNQVGTFEKQWSAVDVSKFPLTRQVDYRLIGSAIARARWELDFQRGWQQTRPADC